MMVSLKRYRKLRRALQDFRALTNPLATLEEARRLERQALSEGLGFCRDAHGEWQLVPLPLSHWLYVYAPEREEDLTRIGIHQEEIRTLLLEMQQGAQHQEIVLPERGPAC
jgi:hypothetical protein